MRVIDCTSLNEGEPITMEHLLAYGEKVKDADFLLFYLGWDERWARRNILETTHVSMILFWITFLMETTKG